MRAVNLVLLAGLVCAFGLQAARPISKDALVNTLKRGGMKNAELAEAIRTTGAGFALNAADESALQALGADSMLITAVRESRVAPNVKSTGRPLTAIELLLKLFHGNPTMARAAVQVRGVAFDLNAELETQLVEGGADQALLALATLRRLEPVMVAKQPAVADAAPPANTALDQSTPVSASSKAVRVDPLVQAKKLIKKPEAEYPQLAFRARMGGTAVIEVLIGRDGRVRRLRGLRGDQVFMDAALEAVRTYVYKPTLLDDQPIEVLTEVTVEFNLAKAQLGMKN